MTIQEAVNKYLTVTNGFGELMPLSRFEVPPAELRGALSDWEEDYHLSRHYELVPASYRDGGAQAYVINGIEYTGIIFHNSIKEILDGA